MKSLAVILAGAALLTPATAQAQQRMTTRVAERATTAYARADIRSGFSVAYHISDCQVIRRAVGRCTLDEQLGDDVLGVGGHSGNAVLRTWITVRRDRAGRLHINNSLFA